MMTQPVQSRAIAPSLSHVQQLIMRDESSLLNDRHRYVGPSGDFVAMFVRGRHRGRNGLAWLGGLFAAIALTIAAIRVTEELNLELGTGMALVGVTFLGSLLLVPGFIYKARHGYLYADEACTQIVATFFEPKVGAFTSNKYRFLDETGAKQAELAFVNMRITGYGWSIADPCGNPWLSTGRVGGGFAFTISHGNQVYAGSTQLAAKDYALDLRGDPHGILDRRLAMGITSLVHAHGGLI